jgi:hypothetical protein
MAQLPKHRRTRTIKPGRVDDWPLSHRPLAELSKLVKYKPSGKHKDYAPPNDEWVPNHRGKNHKCDRFDTAEWGKLQTILQEAICAGCIQYDPKCPLPTRVWALVNNVLHEARLSNQGLGEYHGFPLLEKSQWPRDPNNRLKEAPRVTITTV